jgi:hypothetical protein
VPDWENDSELPNDKFTFARAQYSGYGRGFGGGWRVDYPNADLNFSHRIEQLTAIKADPDGTVVELTGGLLKEYPFVYITDPRSMSLGEDEVKGFREYLLNGGFFMADDFWSEREWEAFYREMKRVLPNIEPVDLAVDHPLFNHIFPLKTGMWIGLPPRNRHWTVESLGKQKDMKLCRQSRISMPISTRRIE